MRTKRPLGAVEEGIFWAQRARRRGCRTAHTCSALPATLTRLRSRATPVVPFSSACWYTHLHREQDILVCAFTVRSSGGVAQVQSTTKDRVTTKAIVPHNRSFSKSVPMLFELFQELYQYVSDTRWQQQRRWPLHACAPTYDGSSWRQATDQVSPAGQECMLQTSRSAWIARCCA